MRTGSYCGRFLAGLVRRPAPDSGESGPNRRPASTLDRIVATPPVRPGSPWKQLELAPGCADRGRYSGAVSGTW
jgi:hypothetical protein